MPLTRQSYGYNLVNVNLTNRQTRDKPFDRSPQRRFFRRRTSACFILGVLFCGFPSLAFSQNPPAAPATTLSAGQQQNQLQILGHVTGTVVDSTGAAVVGAHVKLTRQEESTGLEAVSGTDGQFSFSDVAPGPFQLTITAQGFSTQASSGTLHPGEFCVVPQIQLTIAPAATEVHVSPTSTVELAEEQIKIEEKQRVFGVIPNFYVTYIPDAAPLTPRQKFKLAWKSTVDPVTFAVVGAVAGVQQSQNDFSGYGQGAAGYGRRFGAAYGNEVASTFIGGAILPSLLKQDPRYFYKGTGSVRSRVLYAMANAVICKGDNGHWQPAYSSILGSLAAGGISNAYYPAKNRDDAGLTLENALIGIGTTAAVNIIQEFVVPKFTPKLPNRPSNQP
jgi:Carboxypeptidase regulatory-like domain